MDMTISAPAEIDQLITQGVAFQGAGQLDSAASVYARLLELEPKHAPALYSLAAISLNLGEHTDALTYARRCVKSASASALAWYIHGVALKTARCFDEALRNFDRALSL